MLESISFPTPVISVAVEPKTKADQDKLGDRPRRSSPTRTRRSSCSSTTRPARPSSRGWASCTSTSSSTACKREFSVDANVGKPQVAYRETIRKQVHKVEPAVRPADRRPGPVRARRTSTSSPRAPAAATSSSTRSSAARSRASTSRRSTRASRRRWTTASWPGYPLVDVRATLDRRLATTRSTPRRWRSRSPARWR